VQILQLFTNYLFVATSCCSSAFRHLWVQLNRCCCQSMSLHHI
jgi:hypothetical protein